MALTNPDTPVSEQDLHDFYNIIKPYLGGGGGGGSLPSGGTTGQSLVKHSNTDEDVEWFDVNKEISFDDFNELTQEEKDNGTSYYIPDATVVSNLTVMGNRFDKANIYTTDERMIGRWIDGKPLYQKTISFGVLPNNTTKSVEHSISNISTKFIANAFSKNSNNLTIPIPYATSPTTDQAQIYIDNTYINIKTPSNMAGYTDTYITINYTKTTDTTVNIGTGNDYSTDEQIVGTWINGKPLYQKTIMYNKTNISGNGTFDVTSDLIGVETIYNFKSTIDYSVGSATATEYVDDYARLTKDGNSYKIKLVIGNSTLTTADITITIQYTKTTD